MISSSWHDSIPIVVCWKQNQWDLFRNFDREDMRVSADLMTEHKKTHRIHPFLVRLWLKIVDFPKAMVEQLIITFPTFQWPGRPGGLGSGSLAKKTGSIVCCFKGQRFMGENSHGFSIEFPLNQSSDLSQPLRIASNEMLKTGGIYCLSACDFSRGAMLKLGHVISNAIKCDELWLLNDGADLRNG